MNLKCPVCTNSELFDNPTKIGPAAAECPSCGGHWIDILKFVSWNEKNKNLVKKEMIPEKDIRETRKALLCPLSGVLMTKYRMSVDIEHKIDYSAAAGHIWLDGGEWNLLVAHGLATSLTNILSTEWQRNIREGKAQNFFESYYLETLGPESYQKLKTFREWMIKQETSPLMMGYLQADDPYSAIK